MVDYRKIGHEHVKTEAVSWGWCEPCKGSGKKQGNDCVFCKGRGTSSIWNIDVMWKEARHIGHGRVQSVSRDLFHKHDIIAIQPAVRAVAMLQVTQKTGSKSHGEPLLTEPVEWLASQSELGAEAITVDKFMQEPYPDSVVEILAIYMPGSTENEWWVRRLWWLPSA